MGQNFKFIENSKDTCCYQLFILISKGSMVLTGSVQRNRKFNFAIPNAMPIFRRFVESLGFPPNINFVDALKLDPECNPTQDTQELVRGRDVICRTQPKDDKGRVYNRFDSILGVKRES